MPLWIVIGVIIILVSAAGGVGTGIIAAGATRLHHLVCRKVNRILFITAGSAAAPPEDNLEDIDIDLK